MKYHKLLGPGSGQGRGEGGVERQNLAIFYLPRLRTSYPFETLEEALEEGYL
jgi:hypothetical protein